MFGGSTSHFTYKRKDELVQKKIIPKATYDRFTYAHSCIFALTPKGRRDYTCIILHVM